MSQMDNLPTPGTVGVSQGQLIRRRLFKHKGAMAGLIAIILITIVSFTSVGTVIGGTGKLIVDESGNFAIDGFRIPGWWQYNWFENYDIVNPGGTPTLTLSPFAIGDHPFGQDTLGKDVFARVMRGIQQSLTVMYVIGILTTAIGVLVGSIAGYFRGWIDSLLMRFTDVIIIIPVLILGAVVGKAFGGGSALFLSFFLGLFLWTGLSRLVRAEFLSLREREFVDAARVAGAGPWRIIFKHILPNAIGVIIVNTTLLMSAAILLESSLSYLGFGITAPDISLGQIISEYQEAFSTRPWLFWWPGMFIIIIALSVNFIGDGLRDAFDPRQRRFHVKTDGIFAAVGRMALGRKANENAKK
jgi:ABC-type dipeptide/oligopeptide/nickel transport system permease subunit